MTTTLNARSAALLAAVNAGHKVHFTGNNAKPLWSLVRAGLIDVKVVSVANNALNYAIPMPAR